MRTDSAQDLKTGELLVKEGLVHPDDISTALAIQEKRNASVALEKSRYLGMILCDLNLITPIDNYVVLHNHGKLVTLSSALVQKRMIRLAQIQEMEALSLREDLPLISLLLKTNKISVPVMQQLLFELFHIPFRSISDFIFNPDDRKTLTQIMDQQMSKENGVIPMVKKDNTILFGMTAPENLLLIHGLNQQYPQYRFKTIFIPYSGFSWFHDIIYPRDDMPEKDHQPPKKKELSLLLKTKALIQDPVGDSALIQNFYEQYETIRTLLGYPKTENRHEAFFEFIRQAHASLESEGRSIEFSIKKQDRDLMIAARPKE